MVEATRAVTQDEQQSRDGYALINADGLTLDTQAVPALVTAVAKRLPPVSRRRADAFWVRSTRRVHARTAAAYGIVAVPDVRDDRARITGGRLLQRVHLWTALNGLSLQHMNQLTERADRERQLGLPPVFGPAVQVLVPDGWEPLAAFRVGYPKTRRGRRLSPRRLPARAEPGHGGDVGGAAGRRDQDVRAGVFAPALVPAGAADALHRLAAAAEREQPRRARP